MSVISTFERLRQLGIEFKASSDCSKIHLKEIRDRGKDREMGGEETEWQGHTENEQLGEGSL